MLLSLLLIILVCLISSVVMMLASVISKKTLMDSEKNSPYECGYNPKGSAQLPFSLGFFIFYWLQLFFLIFYVEITLLLPLASIMEEANIFFLNSNSLLFSIDSFISVMLWMILWGFGVIWLIMKTCN